MNDITNVGETINSKESMTSLEIAEVTGKEHSNVMRDIRVIYEQVSNLGGFKFELSSYISKQNKVLPMYRLTKKECLLLASGYDPILRAKIINRWEELELKERRRIEEEKNKSLVLPSYQIEDKIARAKVWIREQEELQQAQIEAKNAQEHVKMLVHDGKPYTSSEIAKELNIKSAQVLNTMLSNRGIQYKQNGTWLLYSKYADKGLVSIKQAILDSGRIIYDRQWTGKGRDFILNLLKES